MQCPKCSNEVTAGTRFCGTCGETQVQSCAACGAESPRSSTFCTSCGGCFGEISVGLLTNLAWNWREQFQSLGLCDPLVKSSLVDSPSRRFQDLMTILQGNSFDTNADSKANPWIIGTPAMSKASGKYKEWKVDYLTIDNRRIPGMVDAGIHTFLVCNREELAIADTRTGEFWGIPYACIVAGEVKKSEVRLGTSWGNEIRIDFSLGGSKMWQKAFVFTESMFDNSTSDTIVTERHRRVLASRDGQKGEFMDIVWTFFMDVIRVGMAVPKGQAPPLRTGQASPPAATAAPSRDPFRRS